MAHALTYAPPGPVAAAFMRSDVFVRGLRGPIGSGKSVACAIELFRRACEQPVGEDGVRRSRFAIIRQTNPQLRTTTIKTWLEWFPQRVFGRFRWSSPYTHDIRLKLPDDSSLEMEVIFLAVERPDDVDKLLSLEITGFWVNEAREVPKSIIDAATGRLRYAPVKDKPCWRGGLLDTNAPETDHWWPIMNGETPVPEWMAADDAITLIKPAGWEFYTQPPAMTRVFDGGNRLVGYAVNPGAENLANLPPNYYQNTIEGKDASWISVYILNELGAVRDGREVYEGYVKGIHVAPGPLEPRDMMLDIGLDFGLSPAAIIGQRWGGPIAILNEVIGSDTGAKRFANRLKQFLASEYPAHYPDRIRCWGDPAGDERAQTDENTPFRIFREAGFLIRPAPSNDIVVRTEAINRLLGTLHDGKPGLLISPKCAVLIAGFDGGYRYARRVTRGFEAQYEDKPQKNRFSHPHDGLQYLALGLGEGRAVLGHAASMKPTVADRSGDPFSRRAARGRGLILRR